MFSYLIAFADNTWSMVAEMAPYLLFGFGIAGLLHVLIRPEFIERWLGKPGLGGVVNASLLGVPMPLCSCSVIPVAASLRKSGATRGATASFLSSTPQTGVDSILATYALLGGLFTIVRVFVSFVCGLVTGYLIELFCKDTASRKPNAQDMPFMQMEGSLLTSPGTKAASENCCASTQARLKRKLPQAASYGFVTLPADLAHALIICLLLAGLITTLMPHHLLTGALSTGPLAFLLATAISLPLYVCATASIPMAYALMAAGLSPGAALVFLITGPATNTATIATVWKMLGRKATAIYLLSLILVSWLAGGLFNAALRSGSEVATIHAHDALHPSAWKHGCGVILIGLLLFSAWKGRQAKVPCCAG